MSEIKVDLAKSLDSKKYAWAIRAGVQGNADSYFISKSLIVLENRV
ncbi:MAG: hypothetical protein HN356_15975 [Calditrichaeota bacterium]|jgi:hypothetical protein|nr:hypothetical protein [Calditrichota bacterium]